MAIAAAGEKDKIMRMKNVNNGRFQPGNQFAVGHGRPRGAKRMLRDVVAGRLNVENFASAVNKDIERAQAGDFRAMLRACEAVRLIYFSDGTDLPRPWNRGQARMKRQR